MSVGWDGVFRDETGRPVCGRCKRTLVGCGYTICVHCKSWLSRAQMEASEKWERWNKERFDRAAAENDHNRKCAILNETYSMKAQGGKMSQCEHKTEEEYGICTRCSTFARIAKEAKGMIEARKVYLDRLLLGNKAGLDEAQVVMTERVKRLEDEIRVADLANLWD